MPKSTKTPEIALPDDQLRVDVGEVPGLIAEALYPPDACNGPSTVSHLNKVVNGNPFGERPTAEELDALNATVWANLPPYVDGISAEEWARYDAAFRAATERPEWELMPTILNPAYNGMGGALMRAQAEAEHQVLLGKALVEGRVTAITHAGAPVLNPFLGHGVYISVHELTRYLAELPLPIALRIGGADEQKPEQPVREDDLAPLIQEVVSRIEAAGGTVNVATVYPRLRELALSGRPPFTGAETKEIGLAWTTAAGKTRYFDKDTLRKRLARRDRR